MATWTRREAAVLLGLGAFSAAARSAERPAGKGKPRLDHIVWAVPDLEEGRKLFEQLTGVVSASGGIAPGRSQSHNALVGLGNGSYLEIFAPRVAMPNGGYWRDLIEDGKPHLASFCLRVEDEFSALLKAMPDTGLKSTAPRAMGRTRTDGIALNWKLLNVSGTTMDNYLPFFIDWLGSKPHPAEDSPQGVRLESFEVRHPQADAMQKIFTALAIDVPVVQAASPSFALHLQTPKGKVVLG